MQRLKNGKKDVPPSRNYWEDPRRQFAEWCESQFTEKNVLLRVFWDLEDRLSLRRASVIFAFCLILAFLVFFQLRVPVDLQIGQTSHVDVASPLSFEMVDEVTTEEKRLKAQNSVAEIFDYDPEVFGRIVASIDRSFRGMRAFGREVKWPNPALKREESLRPFFLRKAAFEKEIQGAVPDDLFEWLVDNKFGPRLENALVRTLEKWYDRKIVDMPVQSDFPSAVLAARTVGRTATAGPEVKVRVGDTLNLANPDAFDIDERGLERFNEADRTYLERLARTLVQANLTLNKAETAERRKRAREEVLPVNISIKKNQNIVPRGTVVQPFHMAIVKQIENLQAERRGGLMAIALALLLGIVILVFVSFQRRYSLQKFRLETKDLAVMMILVVAQVFFTKLFLFIMDAAFLTRHQEWVTADVFLALAPVAAAPMLAGLLIGTAEVVLFFTAFSAIALGLMEDFHFGFFLLSLLGGLAGARGVHNCKKRSDIYMAGLRTGIVNAVLLAAIHLIMRSEQGTDLTLLMTVVAGFLGGILSGMIALMIVPLLETVFNYTTDVKLLELANLNHPLMKEMIVKAPGTYHHSIMVGSMVEAAAEEIGANPLLGKVMSYYHDIGKMEHPAYFVENQRPGHNPHDGISPFMSKTLLVAHVKDGVEMGMRHKLGKPIIDGILQHHGTTLITFFYHRAVEQRGEGDPEVSEEDFRYPGPKPQFKEAGLCMLADSIEAAARTLDEPTPARLQAIVRNIVQKKFSDGQLDECNLTLKEIAKIERAFNRILLGIYHQRIDYPRGAS